jgi:hypothetical protein
MIHPPLCSAAVRQLPSVGRLTLAYMRCLCACLQERLGGKYVSISVTVQSVRAPELIKSTFDAIGEDPRVTMKF